jgi:hypothetical protein
VLSVRKLSAKTAAVMMMLAPLWCAMILHALVLLGVVPHTIVWGGRLNSLDEVRVLEAAAIVVVSMIMAIIASRAGHIRSVLPAKALGTSLWILVAAFSLHTVVNLFAAAAIEDFVFAPLTLLSAVLCFRLAMSE